MLILNLPQCRFFNEATEEFIIYKPVTLKLEHSLISLSKWESKWKKSYLNTTAFSQEEFIDYVRCMSIDGSSVDQAVGQRLTVDDVIKIRDYIADPMTATTFSKQTEKGGKRVIITSEIIYYWMISFDIPFECEKWHLNRLLTLIRVCSLKQNPKKMSKAEAGQMRALANATRRKKLGSKG